MLMALLACASSLFHGLLQTYGGSSNSNLNFLFAGFTVVWVLLLAYIFSLARRQKRLEAELEMLKQLKSEK